MTVPRYYLQEYVTWLREEGVTALSAYGAGVVGRALVSCAAEVGIQIERFIDANAALRGTRVDGIPVASLEEALGANASSIVVASIAFDEEIVGKIHDAARSRGQAPPTVFTIPWGRLKEGPIDGARTWTSSRARQMHRTRLSVLIPTIRGGESLANALDTLVDPDVPGVEYLIGVDSRCPIPLDAFEELRTKHGEALRILRGEDALSRTLNKLVEEARGTYIARADDDDAYLPGRLRLQLEYLDQRPDVDFVGAAMDLIRGERIVGRFMYPSTHEQIAFCALFEGLVVAHPLVMGRADVFRTLRYRNVTAEDYDLWVRAIIAGHRFANLEVPLIRYTLPNYSAEKKAGFAADVSAGAGSLLRDYFGMSHNEATDLTRALSLHERAEFSRERMRELWKTFADAIAARGLGIQTFHGCAERYAPHLLPSLEEFMRDAWPRRRGETASNPSDRARDR